LEFKKGPKDNVRLNAYGDDPLEASETFDAVEEQVERTFTSRTIPILTGVAVILILVFLIALLTEVDPNRSLRYGVARREVIALSKQADQAQTQEEKLNLLFEAQRSELRSLSGQLTPVPFRDILTMPNILNMIVAVGIIGSLLHLGLVCYPSAVFAWGDFGKRYELLKERRKWIRNFVLCVVIGGLLINLVSAGLADRYYRRHKANASEPASRE